MPPSGGAGDNRGGFATTHWSLVVAAGGRGSEASEEALARLCARDGYPVCAFVRRQGASADDAQDLTQGFFARMIEKDSLGAADQSRGRFRSFLLSACQHYLSNERSRARAEKRGGGKRAVPIDAAVAEGRYERALAHADTPERVFDRQWCLTLLEGVLGGLRDDYQAAGKGRLFDRLQEFLTADGGEGTYADAARDMGMTEAAVKVAVHRLRKRYRDDLRRRVAETVASDADVEDEIRYLRRTLGP